MEKNEHTQALLANDELNNFSSEDLVPSTKHRSRKWWQTKSVLVLASLVAFASVTALLGRLLRVETSDEAEASVFQDDYILGNDWDYSAAPQTRSYDWTLQQVDFNPDGIYRPMLLINNQFPGPLVRANEGDTVKVTIHNQLENSTSIHWHGIYQNGTNFMDGTIGVTQCPIAPGGSFTYEFVVSGQSGTYWYHAHHGAQASDGLAGPLVIHSRSEENRHNYSVDRVIMLSDHYHRLTSVYAQRYLGPDMENVEPVPDGALINGRSIRNCDDFPTKQCDNSTKSLTQIKVEQNQKQRLRLINAGAFAEFQFQIDEHELAVIEADGTEVHPSYYHRININPAQRYSVILHANQTHREAFRMRARMVEGVFAGNNPSLAEEVEGIVSYGADKTASPESIDWPENLDVEPRDMNVTELIPTNVVPAPEQEDAFFYFQTNFRIGNYRLSRGFFNESTWKPNVTAPSLMRFVESQSLSSSSPEEQHTPHIDATVFNPKTQLTINSPQISTIDILIHNLDDGIHPFHLHGHKFMVLATGPGYPPRTSLLDGISRPTLQPLYATLDLSNPLRRDTASIPPFSWSLIRFVADNPGVWALHCHNTWHVESGLVMQIVSRANDLKNIHVPDPVTDLCRVPDPHVLEKGSSPKDESYYEQATRGDNSGNASGCEGQSVENCSYDY